MHVLFFCISLILYTKSSISYLFGGFFLHFLLFAEMQGFVHDKLDCRQLHIDISHFCHAADEIAAPSQINQDCVFRTEYLHTKFK